MKLTRPKLLIAILALSGALGLAVQGNNVHAAIGGTVSTFGVDQTITSTSTSVTTNTLFPDGKSTAECYIQVTSKSGPQTTTLGNCTGKTLNITCASGNFTGTPPDKGAAATINGTATWTGVYDNGTTCTTGTKVGGTNPTLTADLTGLAAEQSVVFFLNTDAGNGFNSPNGRNGCWQYFEGGTGTTEKCIQLSYLNGPGGAFYEVTAGATTGTIEQTLGAALNNNGNMTLSGVFINTSGTAQVATAAPTSAPTTVPSPTPVPTAGTFKPATLSQFGTDITLTSTSSGVTSSQPFPDGGTTATCFVKIDQKSGAQTGTVGNCAGYTVTVTCASSQFSSTPATDQHGAAVVSGGTRTLSGAYDTGPSCTTIPKASLTYDVSGLTAGTRLVAWWNNDASPSRNGCVSFVDTTGTSLPQCFTNSATAQNGTFYEAFAGAATGTEYQFQGASNQVGSNGNLTAGGIFIGGAAGVPLSATAVRVQRVHGVNHVRWYSDLTVRGFNVFNARTRLNRHLVTSRTGWYKFATRHAVDKLRLVPVK